MITVITVIIVAIVVMTRIIIVIIQMLVIIIRIHFASQPVLPTRQQRLLESCCCGYRHLPVGCRVLWPMFVISGLPGHNQNMH